MSVRPRERPVLSVGTAAEQLGYWRRGQRMPGFAEQCRQLTEARAVFPWLGEGSQTVRQQALRDFNQAVANWRGGTHRAPRWRKQGRHESFRIVGIPARQGLGGRQTTSRTRAWWQATW